jgi:hypothetical protein
MENVRERLRIKKGQKKEKGRKKIKKKKSFKPFFNKKKLIKEAFFNIFAASVEYPIYTGTKCRITVYIG